MQGDTPLPAPSSPPPVADAEEELRLSLVWVRGDRSEVLSRAKSDPELHGGEASMLRHLLRVEKGDDSFAAIPVFLLRNFAARDLYTRKGAALTPESLDGHRVGIYNWTASGAVWYRHLVRYFARIRTRSSGSWGGRTRPARSRTWRLFRLT